MTFYYESKSEKLGPLMDELARDILLKMMGKGSGNLAPYLGVPIYEVVGQGKTGADVMAEIALIFPMIEDVIARNLKDTEIPDSTGYSALKMYHFINSMDIPPGLFRNIIKLDDFSMDRFETLVDKISSVSSDIGLDIQKLYTSLESLTETVHGFKDITKVMGRYNLFFTSAQVIPDFTKCVGDMIKAGISLEEGINLAKKLYTEYQDKDVSEIVSKLLQSVPEKDMKLVEKELDFMGTFDENLSDDIYTYQTQKLQIRDYGRRTVVSPSSLESKNIVGSESSYGFGVFLPIVGLLSSDNTLNREKSKIVSEKNGLGRGTSLVFEKDNREITVTINYEGQFNQGNVLDKISFWPISGKGSSDTTYGSKVEIEGLSSSEFASYLINFQYPSRYMEALFRGIETFSKMENIPKNLSTLNSTVKYDSSAALYALSQVNLQTRTAGTVLIMVDTKSPADMFNEFMGIENESQLKIKCDTKEGLVKIEIDLGGKESVIERQDFNRLLEILDKYALPPSTPLCTALDLVCYLNENAHPDQIQKLLNIDKQTFMKVGTLFYYPATFKHVFGYLEDNEREYAMGWLYSLKPEAQPADVKDWLNENYHELIVRSGIERIERV